MKLIVEARDYFELMWNLPKVIDPADFPLTATSYFTFQRLDEASFEILRNEKTYIDDSVFSDEVAHYLVPREAYGVVSGLNNEITLSYSAIHFIAEYVWIDNKWDLRWYEDFNKRKESSTLRRLKISADFQNLKKALS